MLSAWRWRRRSSRRGWLRWARASAPPSWPASRSTCRCCRPSSRCCPGRASDGAPRWAWPPIPAPAGPRRSRWLSPWRRRGPGRGSRPSACPRWAWWRPTSSASPSSGWCSSPGRSGRRGGAWWRRSSTASTCCWWRRAGTGSGPSTPAGWWPGPGNGARCSSRWGPAGRWPPTSPSRSARRSGGGSRRATATSRPDGSPSPGAGGGRPVARWRPSCGCPTPTVTCERWSPWRRWSSRSGSRSGDSAR
jgi:hypothetical protein